MNLPMAVKSGQLSVVAVLSLSLIACTNSSLFAKSSHIDPELKVDVLIKSGTVYTEAIIKHKTSILRSVSKLSVGFMLQIVKVLLLKRP